MPASYLVDAHTWQRKRPVGAIGLLPNTVALVRDGSRTRDRQFPRTDALPTELLRSMLMQNPFMAHRKPIAKAAKPLRHRNSHRPIARLERRCLKLWFAVIFWRGRRRLLRFAEPSAAIPEDQVACSDADRR